jgi:ElaB/YqjD/DUF883 family membrane-anchored ribosome-binding protein
MINRLAKPRQSPNGARSAMPPRMAPRQSADVVRDWTRSLENLIGEHPAASLAAAISIGVFVGWLVKRH